MSECSDDDEDRTFDGFANYDLTGKLYRPKDHEIAELVNEITTSIQPLTDNQSVRKRVANPTRHFFNTQSTPPEASAP